MVIETIILPIGISFFTFQGLSYVIDVYKKEVIAQKNIWKLALYILLFPQLIAGPIVRYSDVEKEIDKRSVSLDDFSHGIERFIIGLGKKSNIIGCIGNHGRCHLAKRCGSEYSRNSMVGVHCVYFADIF